MRIVVTGTDTGVGKTYVSAALADADTAYVKAAQTGDDDDAATVRELSGADGAHARALPRAARARDGRRACRRAGDHAARDRRLRRDARSRQVIIEGAGGLLVRFGGGTIADVAQLLDAPLIVVARAGLGTLNHTALTVEAIERRGLTCLGIVIGSWPRDPDLASLLQPRRPRSDRPGPRQDFPKA